MLQNEEGRVASIKEQNENKKKYLHSYQQLKKAEQRIELEIEELRASKIHPSVQTNGMPSGSEKKDYSDYAAELDRLERQLIRTMQEKIKKYKEILHAIEAMECEEEKNVLILKYIKRKSMKEIAQIMQYSERSVARIHGHALLHFLKKK